MSSVKPLYFQFLLSFLILSLNISIYGIKSFATNVNCYLFHFLGCFGGSPTGLSLLSIVFHSFFILTNNCFFQRNKGSIIFAMIFMTWIFSVANFILFLVYMKFMDNNCTITKKFYEICVFILNILTELITVILCGLLIWKVCNLNAHNDKELEVSKKKTVSKLVLHIFAVSVGIILKFVAFLPAIEEKISSILKIILLINFFCLNYIFLWTKQFREVCLDIYCCRKVQESEEKIQNNNQKELIFQNDFDEE